jgi:hypothetical protein
MEYTADTFNGAMRGDLIAQKWNQFTYRIELSPDGQSADTVSQLSVNLNCLDILQGPGGVLIGIDYTENTIVIAPPNDVAASGVTVYDIFPWRAPATGGHPFVIGGSGFGALADTTVSIGGEPCTLTSVSPTRIRGTIPAKANPTADLLNVEVTVAGETDILHQGFRYLFGPGLEDTKAGALIEIDPGDSINPSSTFQTGSFRITNTSTRGQKIERIRFDLRSALFPDIVFDPDGTAGDPVGKPITIDANQGIVVTQSATVVEHDGGYDVAEIGLADFEPGEMLAFSVDCDPTSVKGADAPGPNHAGSISGIELIGAAVTVFFDDGTSIVGYPYRTPGSETGAEVVVQALLPPKPTITAAGFSDSQATTSTATQTITAYGPEGATVSLLVVEGALYLFNVPNGGFDIDPYEANTAVSITEYAGVIGASGTVDIPITLTRTDSFSGLNYITAALVDGNGNTGPTSNVLVLDLIQP